MELMWIASLLAVASPAEPVGAPWLVPVARIAVEHAEIPAFDPTTRGVFVAAGGVVATMELTPEGELKPGPAIDVAAAAGFPAGVQGEISHVAIDPRGRGFLAATVIPSERSTLRGRVVFVSTRDHSTLAAVEVGFQPDGCEFATDGRCIVVVNEGEPTILPGSPPTVVDPPGSISVIDLASITVAGDFEKLDASAATTYDVSGDDLDLAATRIHPFNAQRAQLDLEPESVAIADQRAYVTFQENSALGVFDLAARKWLILSPLAPLAREFDASDRDGGIHIDSAIEAWPMPDQIAIARVPQADGSERVVLVVANEGDDRGDVYESASPLADSARVGDLRARGRIATSVPPALDRCKVDAHHGDLDGDGVIEHPYALGARSVSIHDARTLERLGDTASKFERETANACPTAFNADGKAAALKVDARSDDAGPEPEGVRTIRIDDRAWAIVTLERPGVIALVDVSEPTHPQVAGLACVALGGDLAPEGLTIVPAQNSPLGDALVFVAYEGSGAVVVYRLRPPRSL
jgi:hypothetical protein